MAGCNDAESPEKTKSCFYACKVGIWKWCDGFILATHLVINYIDNEVGKKADEVKYFDMTKFGGSIILTTNN